MTTEVLDEQARDVLRRLQPGHRFTLRSERGVFHCQEVIHPVEGEPWVRAYRFEEPWGCTAFRAIRISKIEGIWPKE